MSTSEGKCVLVEVGALISWCIYSYRIVMLLVPYIWASMTFLPFFVSLACLRKRESRGGTPYIGQYGEVPPKRDAFFKFGVY